ncbi:MAG TPA: isoprenylcysteine carboxylmethyltransferase family protein [Candidatus Cybelea sp.]|nr:isoprenylcysteine carboxylmethyltransferase family protein [Candidatus Cybelea sp.]
MKTAITVVAMAAALAGLFWYQSKALGPLTPSREIGIVLAIIGFLLWAVARIELGRSFSVRAKATQLVTRGIYSKIRNPVYVFGTVFIVGMILWAARPKWLLALVIIVPMQVLRARKEAQVLEAKFGDAYRAYRAHTWL